MILSFLSAFVYNSIRHILLMSKVKFMKLRECISLPGTGGAGLKSTFPISFYYSYDILDSHYEKEALISIKITLTIIKTLPSTS